MEIGVAAVRKIAAIVEAGREGADMAELRQVAAQMNTLRLLVCLAAPSSERDEAVAFLDERYAAAYGAAEEMFFRRPGEAA